MAQLRQITPGIPMRINDYSAVAVTIIALPALAEGLLSNENNGKENHGVFRNIARAREI